MSADPGPPSITLCAALGEAARRWPDKPALLSEQVTLTWSQLRDEVDRLASVLHRAGVRPGHVVGFMITKRPEVVTGFLACARLDAVMAPINFKLHPDHIRDQVRTAGIRAVFTESVFDNLLRQLLPHLPDPNRIIYVDGPGRHGATWTGQEPEPVDLDAVARPEASSVCYFNYTSGTTGRPKGAITTHANILDNARYTVDALGFSGDDIFLGMFSVFAHPHELFHRSLVTGAPFVILDTMSPRVVARAVRKWAVTWMMAVPSFYEMMIDHVRPDGSAYGGGLGSLRVLESGGAYVGSTTMEAMEEAFGATFLPVWGCTEATGVALANGPGPDRRPGASGRPLPGYEVRVIDDRGREVEAGEVGQMVLRGSAVAHGYINNPDETAAVFRHGWYETRDLVRCDAEGYIHFTSRRSEMLKIGGIRVYPLEIEMVLHEHPEIRDVVVVRAEERVRGEIARAIVTLAEGSRLDGKAIRQYCRERMAVYKVPRIVEIWREIPKLPNGKIDKRAVVAVEPDPARDER